ncbi:unnamed protein product [Soboliphyme baturini]|uniref:ShKT domain-containing protein n=1 Tax=Soboliphyme baturini TaxID=241478 RepID=A0A183JB25_9BILA|nr:unnamed protein product [Soboliphyme baturini]
MFMRQNCTLSCGFCNSTAPAPDTVTFRPVEARKKVVTEPFK